MNDWSSIKKLIRSFGFSFQGIKEAIKSEQNFRIHIIAAIITIGLSFIFKISLIEWSLIIFCIALVFALEIINTCIEKICNIISPEKKEAIRIIKDLSAAAVFIVALAALLLGLIIFIPYIIKLF